MRRIIHRSLIVFGVIVAFCFGYGAYLRGIRRPPSREFVLAASTNETVEGLAQSGARYLESNRVEQALIAYRKALTIAPNSIEAQMGVARSELAAGRESVAAKEFERALVLDAGNTSALQQLGRIYSHQRETWSASERKYKAFLRLMPGDAGTRLELARVLVWQRKAGEAVDTFSQDTVRRLMTREDEKSYALVLVQTGRNTEAEAVLQKLSALQPADFDLKLQLAAIYAARRDWKTALPLYQDLLRERPGDSRLNFTYGLGLLSSKNYKAALGPLEKARSQMPTNADAGLGYARALKGSGDLRKAAQEFGRVAEVNKDAGIIREYADLLLEKRDYRGAEKSYKEALQLGLRDERILMSLAGALRANGKHKDALSYLEEAYAKQPTDRLAFELASTLERLGQHKRALALLARIDKPAR